MTEDTLRLFFALPCATEDAEAICTWRAGLNVGGKPVVKDNFHVTLAFLGNQPAEAVPGLLALAAQVQGRPFTLTLDCLTTIGRDHACLQPSHPPHPLFGLQSRLKDRLLASGLPVDDRPYLPHLTLARHASPTTRHDAPAFSWCVDRFSLYVSENGPAGVRYRALGSWPLQDECASP